MERTDWRSALLGYLPPHIVDILGTLAPDAPLTEIRLRACQPLQLCFSSYERLIYAAGGRPVVSETDCAETLKRICDNSIYAWEEELKNGFITLQGGCRVGVTGRAVLQGGSIAHIADVTGLNIRIGRACVGIAERLMPLLTDQERRPLSTLVLSPPGCGKTTLLRDMARACSLGGTAVRPCRVAIVDSRYELSGSVRGVPQYDLGPRTDVLTGAGKAEGLRLAINSMSPEIAVVDELSTAQDLAAAADAAGCGVRVFAGVHSGAAELLVKRKRMRALLCEGLFRRFVVLSGRLGAGTVEGVYDEALRPLNWNAGEGTWQSLSQC